MGSRCNKALRRSYFITSNNCWERKRYRKSIFLGIKTLCFYQVPLSDTASINEVMDVGEVYYMDLRKHLSTRRYIYEGFGGQKHDKTLILHKSEANPDDTIILRLCKRIGARLSWSSCFRGKLLLATLLAILAMLCYFNLFSNYLPRPCGAFSSTANRKLKSLANETVLIRSKNSFADDLYDLLNPAISNSKYVSEFTKKVALDMQENGISTTIFRKYSEAIVGAPNTVIYEHSVTTSPTSVDVQKETAVLEQSILVAVELHRIDQWKTDPMPLISRLIQSRRAILLN